MSTPPTVVQMPDRDTLMRRLMDVDPSDHIAGGLYPTLANLANRDQTGIGVVLALHLAVADYTADMPPLMVTIVLMRAEDLVRALLVDSPILNDAIAALGDLGLLRDSN